MSKIPRICMIPSAFKSGKVYSVLPTDGSGDLNFTRASEATRVNQNGLIETVGSNVPRIDYTDGGCPSLLLEPQSTNLITYSEDFSDASWNKSNASVTGGFISPSGTANAFKLVENSSNSSHYISRNDVFTVDGNTRDFSIFVKEGERRYIFITNVTTINNDINCVVFDTRMGTFTNTNDPTIILNRNVTPFKNGWYRIDFTSNVNNGAYDNFYIGISSTDDMSGVSYQGDGTSGVYIWGAQLEQQSYPTSYIPTSGATATRVAETLSKSGLSNYINSSEGVLYAEMSALADDGTLRNITINDNTTNNSIRLYYSSTSNTLTYRVVVGGVPSVSSLNTTINQVDTIKVAVKWKANDFAVYVNGVKEAEQLSGVSFSANTLTTLDLKRPNNTEYFYGNIKDLRVYDTALSDAELIALTQV